MTYYYIKFPWLSQQIKPSPLVAGSKRKVGDNRLRYNYELTAWKFGVTICCLLACAECEISFFVWYISINTNFWILYWTSITIEHQLIPVLLCFILWLFCSRLYIPPSSLLHTVLFAFSVIQCWPIAINAHDNKPHLHYTHFVHMLFLLTGNVYTAILSCRFRNLERGVQPLARKAHSKVFGLPCPLPVTWNTFITHIIIVWPEYWS